MRVKNRMVWGVVVCVCAVSCCGARTWTVGTGAGYDYSRIQPAIDAAVEGDTIVVAKGWYEEGLRFKGRNITLMSTDPDDWDVVNRTAVGTGDLRAITFTGQEDASCVIRGLRLGGMSGADIGGCVSGRGSQATILQCAIGGGEALYGGGLHDCDGLIEDCRIESNRARYGGAGRRSVWL